ncbi:MAG: sensor histidine kinase [Micropruina sp.]|uniref:sensor histidine kinase n=1 Tax=Micropruina sp. TaxID=2737536 RepID=UPI0039E58EB2
MTQSVPSHEAAVRSRLKPPPNPLRMLVSPLGWGAVAYCATAILGGILALIAGIVGLIVLPVVAWGTANVEGKRLRLLGLRRPGPLPSGPIRHPWDANGLRSGNLAVWGIAVLFALVDFVPGAVLVVLVLGFVSQLIGHIGEPLTPDHLGLWVMLIVILIAGLYVAWALASVQAILVEDLIRPRTELREQVDQLTSSRRELVDVFAAERRRIERDLHDGAQQHLVLLSMQLGEAEYALDTGRPEAVRDALAAAHSSMEAAMTSLRDTVRGIHPQILTDRGLADAVRELSERQPVPVTVTISGDRQPPEQLALAAYYLVSEAFTNAVKHAQASTMAVRVAQSDQLQIEVYDDGRGGAVVRPGHGLSGMIERVQAFGGGCWVSSPPGGPTIIRASFPHPPGGQPLP